MGSLDDESRYAGTLIRAFPRQHMVRTTVGWAMLGQHRHEAFDGRDFLTFEKELKAAEATCVHLRRALLHGGDDAQRT